MTMERSTKRIVTILLRIRSFCSKAKSGRVHEAARRGAELKLVHNLKELFVEPAKQAARLEQYLNQKGRDARLWIKDTNEPVHLDLSKTCSFTNLAFASSISPRSQARGIT